MIRSKYTYILAIITLALTGYLYFSQTEDVQVVESPQTDISIPVNPEELEELKKDPSAPADRKSVV